MEQGIMWCFVNRKPSALLIALEKLKDPTPKYISSETGIPFDQAVNTLEALEELGFVYSLENGDERHFELTPSGSALSGRMIEIESLFRKWPKGERMNIGNFHEKAVLRGV